MRPGARAVVAALPSPWHSERERDDGEYGVTHSVVGGNDDDIDLYEVGFVTMGPDAVYARAADAAAHFRSVTEGYGHPAYVVSGALYALMWGHKGNDREVSDLAGFAVNDSSGA